jgi:hypothetical protein
VSGASLVAGEVNPSVDGGRSAASPDDLISMDVHAVEVSPAGAVATPFPIAEAPEREGAPKLAASPGGLTLAAYTRFVPSAPYSARRAHARLLSHDEGTGGAGGGGAGGSGVGAGGGAVGSGAGGDGEAGAVGSGGGALGGGPPHDGCGVHPARPAPAAALALLGPFELRATVFDSIGEPPRGRAAVERCDRGGDPARGGPVELRGRW